ncbi:hypothetical protein SAMN04490184_2301 [Pseudomonas extremorientalis]|uniref:Uncharacterized protein n=1 Tax=Pseudomonas extremorientalis TaxID=169669 RepID=A0ABY0SDH4_9PSED|nr:hypothetical protein SAMN04490184_2301 [Pseudomonas extremorientalis]
MLPFKKWSQANKEWSRRMFGGAKFYYRHGMVTESNW